MRIQTQIELLGVILILSISQLVIAGFNIDIFNTQPFAVIMPCTIGLVGLMVVFNKVKKLFKLK
jgi:hypothetical protein